MVFFQLCCSLLCVSGNGPASRLSASTDNSVIPSVPVLLPAAFNHVCRPLSVHSVLICWGRSRCSGSGFKHVQSRWVCVCFFLTDLHRDDWVLIRSRWYDLMLLWVLNLNSDCNCDDGLGSLMGLMNPDHRLINVQLNRSLVKPKASWTLKSFKVFITGTSSRGL